MKDPADLHIEAVKNLMRYIRSTITHRMKYSKGVNPTLSLHLDADWAGQLIDRKSTSGSAGMLYNRVITWSNKVQRSVATSSTESEYLAMSMTAKMSQWIAQVLRDIGYSSYIGDSQTRVDIRADNQRAITLTKNPHLHDRSRHIDICYYHIRDLQEREKISITYIPTDEMITDGFTKPLQRIAFIKFKSFLGIDTTLPDQES